MYRELVTTIQLYMYEQFSFSESTPDSCGVMLIEHLPSGLYVDIDQVSYVFVVFSTVFTLSILSCENVDHMLLL